MRNMGLTPKERRVLRAVENRSSTSIDWAALAVVVGCGLGIIAGLCVIAKYVFNWGG